MTPPRSGTCCLRSASSSRSVWATRISNRFEPRRVSTDGPRFDSWSGGDRLPASRAHASNGSSGEPDRTRGSGASSIVRSWRSPVECACRLFRRETSYCSSCSPAAPRTPGTWSSCWPVRIATRRSPKSRPTSATCRPGAGSSGAGLSEAGPPEGAPARPAVPTSATRTRPAPARRRRPSARCTASLRRSSSCSTCRAARRRLCGRIE